MCWVFSLCLAFFFTCKHFNSPLISKKSGLVEKKGSDDVNKTGKGERRKSRFSLFHYLPAVFHYLLSSLWQQFVRTKADYCDPTRSIPFILLARWPECINPVSVRIAALHLSCLTGVTAASAASVYPLATLTGSITVSANLHGNGLTL